MYVGIIKFMECILLAMAFVNALNETARDCDVYRMFSRGKGSARALRRRGLLMESDACVLRRTGRLWKWRITPEIDPSQRYAATVAVQMSFRWGVAFNFIAVMLAGVQSDSLI